MMDTVLKIIASLLAIVGFLCGLGALAASTGNRMADFERMGTMCGSCLVGALIFGTAGTIIGYLRNIDTSLMVANRIAAEKAYSLPEPPAAPPAGSREADAPRSPGR